MINILKIISIFLLFFALSACKTTVHKTESGESVKRIQRIDLVVDKARLCDELWHNKQFGEHLLGIQGKSGSYQQVKKYKPEDAQNMLDEALSHYRDVLKNFPLADSEGQVYETYNYLTLGEYLPEEKGFVVTRGLSSSMAIRNDVNYNDPIYESVRPFLTDRIDVTYDPIPITWNKLAIKNNDLVAQRQIHFPRTSSYKISVFLPLPNQGRQGELFYYNSSLNKVIYKASKDQADMLINKSIQKGNKISLYVSYLYKVDSCARNNKNHLQNLLTADVIEMHVFSVSSLKHDRSYRSPDKKIAAWIKISKSKNN